MAVTTENCPNCIAGITFFTPIAAVLNTPQRIFFVMRSMIVAAASEEEQ